MEESSQEQKPNPHPNPLPKGEGERKSVNFFLLFEAGIEFAIFLALPLIAGVYLGKWLDAKYGTKFIIIICILLGLAFGWYMVFKKIKDLKNTLNIK